MDVDLRTLVGLQKSPWDELNRFIDRQMVEAGGWISRGDDILSARVVESEAERLRICGRIHDPDQWLKSFWLDVEAEPSGGGVAWVLYLDSVASSPRRARNAIDTFDRAEDIDWRIVLEGRGEVRDGALVVTSAKLVDEDDDLDDDAE